MTTIKPKLAKAQSYLESPQIGNDIFTHDNLRGAL